MAKNKGARKAAASTRKRTRRFKPDETHAGRAIYDITQAGVDISNLDQFYRAALKDIGSGDCDLREMKLMKDICSGLLSYNNQMFRGGMYRVKMEQLKEKMAGIADHKLQAPLAEPVRELAAPSPSGNGAAPEDSATEEPQDAAPEHWPPLS